MLKKKFVITVLLLSILFTGCSASVQTTNPSIEPSITPSESVQQPVMDLVKPSEIDADFRTVKWGMSKDDVMNIEGPVYAEEDSGMMYPGVNVAGYDANLVYYFNETGELYKGAYVFNILHANENDYFSDFTAIGDKLVKLYGDPSQDELVWKDDTYKNNESKWGLAVAWGDLIRFATWDTDKTKIAFMLSGDNLSINLVLIYTSIDINPPQESTSGL